MNQAATPTTDPIATGTPIKHRGRWAVKITDRKRPVRAGDFVRVTTKAGRSWKAEIARVTSTPAGSRPEAGVHIIAITTTARYNASR